MILKIHNTTKKEKTPGEKSLINKYKHPVK